MCRMKGFTSSFSSILYGHVLAWAAHILKLERYSLWAKLLNYCAILIKCHSGHFSPILGFTFQSKQWSAVNYLFCPQYFLGRNMDSTPKELSYFYPNIWGQLSLREHSTFKDNMIALYPKQFNCKFPFKGFQRDLFFSVKGLVDTETSFYLKCMRKNILVNYIVW